MTTTVSYSEFRKNLSKYIELLHKDGVKVSLEDARTGKKLITLSKVIDKDGFDWDKHLKELKEMKPFLTDEGVRSMKKFREEINERFERAAGR